MKIKIGKRYYLNADSNCFFITKVKIPKDKTKDRYEIRVSGYHRNLEDLILSFIEYGVRMTDRELEDLKELAEYIEELKLEVKSWNLNKIKLR